MKMLKKLTKFNMIFTLLAVIAITTPNIIAFELSNETFSQLEERVNSMSSYELNKRYAELKFEQKELNYEVSNGNTDTNITKRLKEINDELSLIQKLLIAIAGLGAVSALTDDGYDDNVPPVITVLGDNPATVELGSTYTDAGATADDAFHGSTPVISSGTVDTTTVGSYTISYSATDLDGNSSSATRTVNVVDTTAPVVTVTGDNPASVELGATYTDAGATATDTSGTVEVVSSGTVDTDTVGEYVITYSATDASGDRKSVV